MAIWLPNKECQCDVVSVKRNGAVEYGESFYCKFCRGHVQPDLLDGVEVIAVPSEASNNHSVGNRRPSVGQGEELVVPSHSQSYVDDAIYVQSTLTSANSAALASMGYLHAIALVVIAGVITGLSAGIGAILSLTFDAVEAAASFFIIGGLLGIAMMIASIVALIRADVDRNTARRNTR